MTRFGMVEKDFDELAKLMESIIVQNKNVADDVANYRQSFSKMKFCLSPEQTLYMVPAIFESIFPEHDYFLSFAEALSSLK